MNSRSKFVGLLAGGGLAALSVAMAAPVSAAGGIAALNAGSAHFGVPSNSSSTAFAGYAVLHPPASSAAGDTFKVPKLTCSPGTGLQSAIAPGSFLSGAEFAASGVIFACFSGSEVYQIALEVDNTATSVSCTTVAIGDTINTSATETATKETASFKDVTHPCSKTITGAKGGKATLVFDGIDSVVTGSPPHQVPTSNFGKLTFTAGSLDGKTVKASGAIAVDQKTATHVLQISTGPLNTLPPAPGTSWTETWHHS